MPVMTHNTVNEISGYIIYYTHNIYIQESCGKRSDSQWAIVYIYIYKWLTWKSVPQMAPMVKAPPQSSTILQGHGSRLYSMLSITYKLSLRQ